jgi:ribose 5-phosphate isomerase B
MRFIVGTDEARPVVEYVAAHLQAKGHDVVVLPVAPWGEVALGVARAVAGKRADHGVVCCWTGTGASIAANKVKGVRAALSVDATTAAGARQWNDANVLALSLRLLSEPLAKEIVDAWLDTAYGGTEDASLAALAAEEGAAGEEGAV